MNDFIPTAVVVLVKHCRSYCEVARILGKSVIYRNVRRWKLTEEKRLFTDTDSSTK